MGPGSAAVLLYTCPGAHWLRDSRFHHRFIFHKILPSWLALVVLHQCRLAVLLPGPLFAGGGSRRLCYASLAGRLGFEPRQSAPKALDLPLVDRPVLKTRYKFNALPESRCPIL